MQSALPREPCLVSVGLVVKNAERTVSLAVRSIVAQTYPHWELLVADDGSSDATVEILRGFRDQRIHLIAHKHSSGLAARLNQLTEMSRGKYFARMDGDDFAFSERLAGQVQFLERHPEVDLLGCGTINFEGEGTIVGKSRAATTHGEICRYPWRGFPLSHPTWMGRRDWFRANKYEARLRRAQDFDLLLRTFRTSRFHCLAEPLLGYRVEQLTLSRQFRSRTNVIRILLRHTTRPGGARFLWGAGTHAVMFGLDSIAILTGLRFKLLRHRALPVPELERKIFLRNWAALQSS
jgi:glycosyltransferase involved in cell wall biosynthesis